jgi:hypothetical protein
LIINNYIRRSFAAFFLLLFSFCITPKRFLHDTLAHHRDAQSASRFPFEQITASGFHCHVDDLVVVAPFLPELPQAEPVLISYTSLNFSEPLHHFAYPYRAHFEGRGPPADFCI